MVKMRNKDKHTTDWTTVLQERLRDASLPLEDGWAAGAVSRKSGFSGSWAPWGWALAGAAAALAAVLVLRPAAPSGEEPVRLVEAPAAEVRDGGAAQDLAVAQVLSAVAQTPDVTQARVRRGGPNPSTKQAGNKDGVEKEAHPSTNQARNMDGTGQTGIPSTNGTGNAEESPNQVRNDGDVARSDITQAGQPVRQQSLEELTQGDFATAGEPGAADVARRRRPVSLRLQAATPGASLAAGGMFAAGPVAYSDPLSLDNPEYGKTVKPGSYSSDQAPSADRAPVFPVSVGISAAVPLSRRWTLAAGLEYTQRAGAVVQSAAGSSSAQSVTLHYLGVPLDLHCYLNPDDRLRVWLGGGLKAEKAIHVTGAAPLRDPVLCSWNLQAGADLRVLPGVRIYLSPALTRYLNHSAYAVSWDERSNFSLRAGLSFDLK